MSKKLCLKAQPRSSAILLKAMPKVLPCTHGTLQKLGCTVAFRQSTGVQQGLLWSSCTCFVGRVLPPTRPMTRHCRCSFAGATSTTLLRLPVWWYLQPSQISCDVLHGTLQLKAELAWTPG